MPFDLPHVWINKDAHLVIAIALIQSLMTAHMVGSRATAIIAAVVLEQGSAASPFYVPLGGALFIDLSMYSRSTGRHRLVEKRHFDMFKTTAKSAFLDFPGRCVPVV